MTAPHHPVNRHRRTRYWRLLAPTAALATLVLLVGCSQNGANQSGGAEPDTGHDETESGLAHIHGLGIDPADGVLSAASHHGVFRIPDGGVPERVSEVQDTMGFTVVGPNHFLGSGHPAPDDTDRPPHLGLIESTDAGHTWQTLSLSGEVDFHALEAKHDRVYGYDSQTQQVMVSTDRKNWDRRAQLPLADFAVHPDNPDELLATTQQGLARSTDGGRTFTPVPGAPLLQLVDWPAEDTLVAVAPDGSVHHSTDSGTTWTSQGTVPGAPQALATHDTTEAYEVYVATETGIHHSSDGGRTFTLRQPLT